MYRLAWKKGHDLKDLIMKKLEKATKKLRISKILR